MVLSVLLAAILDFLRDIPQNKNVILNTKIKFVCPLCTQKWCIIMIIETLPAILAAILFCNFEREKLKIELGMGQIWNQHIHNCVKTTAWQILLKNALQTLRMVLFEKWALTNRKYPFGLHDVYSNISAL